MPENVLVLGGGVGGVAAANALRGLLPRRHRIVLVDREQGFTLAASFLWVVTGARTPEQFRTAPRSPAARTRWRCRKLEAWRRDYNQNRPHSSIGDLTPVEFANQVRTETQTVSEVSQGLKPSRIRGEVTREVS